MVEWSAVHSIRLNWAIESQKQRYVAMLIESYFYLHKGNKKVMTS
ncbi:MAG: hypothetical protein RIT35_1727 [Pseudomonadota bacterium]